VQGTAGQSSLPSLSLREDHAANLSVTPISGMLKDKRLIWKNQHSSTNTIAFCDETTGSTVLVIKAAHTDF